MIVLYPNLCYNEVCNKGTAMRFLLPRWRVTLTKLVACNVDLVIFYPGGIITIATWNVMSRFLVKLMEMGTSWGQCCAYVKISGGHWCTPT